jgi:hypothetical protein
MNVIEKETRDFGAEKPKSTLEEDLEWEMEADTSAWVRKISPTGVFGILSISS